jgi:hypothetical protein
MIQRLALALGAIAWLGAVADARAASPLDDLIAPGAGNSACFARVYDAEHLRKNPTQKTTAMTVWLKYGNEPGVGLGIAISQRGDPLPFFAQGGCAWDSRANRDTSDRRMIREFKKEPGAGCMMSARPDVFDTLSAEEGGYLIIDRGKDRNTLLVYLQDGMTMVKQADRAKQLEVDFGPADRVFLLHRTAAKDCDSVVRALSR